MPIQAVLFDLDNTLYPASCGLLRSVEQRISQFLTTALGLEQQAALELCKQYYTTYGTTLRGLQTNHAQIEAETYLDFIHDVAVEEYVQSNERLAALLATLPLQKIIFTNAIKEYAERVLSHLGIRQHFAEIFDVRFSNFVGKPDPTVYLAILDRLGLKGSEVIMVEDTGANLPPAKGLGMTTILIDETGLLKEGADFIVTDVLAALEVVHRLVQPSRDHLPSLPHRRRNRRRVDQVAQATAVAQGRRNRA